MKKRRKIHINSKYIEVNQAKAIIVSTVMIFMCAYLAYDNFFRDGVIAIGKLASFCMVITMIATGMLLYCKFGKRKIIFLEHAACLLIAALFWFTHGYFLYTGGTGGTSIFLLFISAPIAYLFFNFFYGTLFCFVELVGMCLYFWTPLHEAGYAFPQMYYQRMPIMYVIEVVPCALAQYEIVTGTIRQEEALRQVRAANEAKSDFLANTSHEIRTPLNAILGFCELILREEGVGQRVREYCQEIRTAGNNLLYIINDILDISKIEAGRIELVKEKFTVPELVNEVVNMAIARKKDKPLEILVSGDPLMPEELIADVGRIRQVIVNLVTNAIKYTPEGGVVIDFIYNNTNAPSLEVRVKDTGIGIEEKNLGKIFESFQQVDMKRNRSIEGTGLGLAISIRLAKLMGGEIQVESEYGKGSVFTFIVPVEISGSAPVIDKDDFKMNLVGICTSSASVNERIREDYEENIRSLCRQIGMLRMQVPSDQVAIPLQWEDLSSCFVDVSLYQDHRDFFDRVSGKTKIVLMQDLFSREAVPEGMPVIKKPVYSYVIGSYLEGRDGQTSEAASERKWAVYKVKALVVDDNPVNLKVITKLLETYGLELTSAGNGFEALEEVKKEDFDLIFMDHMMPEMDGVETAKRILSEGEAGAHPPIIALTANAISGMREMFLSCGFSDFLSKPIVVSELERVLGTFLKEQAADDARPQEKEEGLPQEAASALQSSALFDYEMARQYRVDLENLSLYVSSYEKTKTELLAFYKAKDWNNYKIRVHALKSSSRMIGAASLGNLAEEAEAAAREGDEQKISQLQEKILEMYEQVVLVARRATQLGEEKGEGKKEEEEEGQEGK